MPLYEPKRPLTATELATVPEATGVYLLWNGDRPVAMGLALEKSGTLRNHLTAELEKLPRRVPSTASHFSYMLTANPPQLAGDIRVLLAKQGITLPVHKN